MQLENDVAEAFARLTVLEFAIEVMLSNELASIDPSSSEKFKSDFHDRMRKPWSKQDLETTEAEQFLLRTVEIAENLMHKVSDRETQIRRAASR